MYDNQLFHFERWVVYRVAREALQINIRCRSSLRGLPGELCSQLERSMLSTVANIAEAIGRDSAADRRRHFAIARGSVNEAGAIVEIAVLYGALTASDHRELRSRLMRVAWMLTALLRR